MKALFIGGTGTISSAITRQLATVRFDQGARIAVEYMLSHKECQQDDPEFDQWCDSIIAAQEEAKQRVLSTL